MLFGNFEGGDVEILTVEETSNVDQCRSGLVIFLLRRRGISMKYIIGKSRVTFSFAKFLMVGSALGWFWQLCAIWLARCSKLLL